MHFVLFIASFVLFLLERAKCPSCKNCLLWLWLWRRLEAESDAPAGTGQGARAACLLPLDLEALESSQLGHRRKAGGLGTWSWLEAGSMLHEICRE